MRVLVVALLLLTACKPSSQIDVDPLLIQQGDLPDGVVAGQIRDDTPIDDPPNVSRVSYQEFVHDGAVAGGVTVWLFPSNDAAKTAYTTLTPALPVQMVDEVGEQRAATVDDPLRMAFVRCNSVAYITLENSDATNMIAYAKRLDQRLTSVVC